MRPGLGSAGAEATDGLHRQLEAGLPSLPQVSQEFGIWFSRFKALIHDVFIGLLHFFQTLSLV